MKIVTSVQDQKVLLFREKSAFFFDQFILILVKSTVKLKSGSWNSKWLSRSGPHQDRPWTANNPTGKSHMRLDTERMDMENVVYRMQCVVYEKGDHVERCLCLR
ncbi:hypothetical protein AVEN_24840-1 [Araneus ventricosus]|uniref:Uncharacterized protein n=1 Tax=Araneus ventricosus TaxID=182803 RepID=A0A4Y2BU76_ARAVE|nr:hypothetical protein AVEN_24840-1 [Araneus ventricosus]